MTTKCVAFVLSTWVGTVLASSTMRTIPTPPVPESGTLGAVAFVGVLAGMAVVRRRRQLRG